MKIERENGADQRKYCADQDKNATGLADTCGCAASGKATSVKVLSSGTSRPSTGATLGSGP